MKIPCNPLSSKGLEWTLTLQLFHVKSVSSYSNPFFLFSLIAKRKIKSTVFSEFKKKWKKENRLRVKTRTSKRESPQWSFSLIHGTRDTESMHAGRSDGCYWLSPWFKRRRRHRCDMIMTRVRRSWTEVEIIV